MRCFELAQQITGALDRACHKLRKKRHKECVCEKITLSRDLFPVHVHRVAECLKGIEGNANGQKDIKSRDIQRNVRLCKHCLQESEGKVKILEPDQDAEV